ncbi:MAG TPA: short-chain dehydrogenase [Actinobacteria bacterium]|nr:short-chain dehydrogenase [Actinomycetota bacterium]
MSGLRGKTVVVTGAARGIGAALALGLAQQGAQVALVGLEPAELEDAAAACGQHGQCRAWVADVTDHDRMSAVAGQVTGHFGGVDVVVANAGIAIGGTFADSDPAAFSRVIEVNLLGSATTARAFLPGLQASGGYFLQVASLAAITPAPLMAAYCASKAGVEAFAHVLRAEVAHQGVGVGVAYLTWTDTDMVRAADADDALRQLRAALPWPANRTAPLGPAVARIVAGIDRRAAHIYAQRWVRGLAWLPRAALPAAIARRAPREVARLDAVLRATAHHRLRPVGPGGLAAFAGLAGEMAASEVAPEEGQ